MDDSRGQAREIAAAIARILRDEWDPLGVREIPEAAGEYDSYAGGVYQLLATGATVAVLAEHLRRVESQCLGLAMEPAEPLAPVARKLLDLNVKLRESDS